MEIKGCLFTAPLLPLDETSAEVQIQEWDSCVSYCGGSDR